MRILSGLGVARRKPRGGRLPQGLAGGPKLIGKEAGGGKFSILSLSKSGTHREPAEDGERIVLGGQTIRLVDGKIVLGKFAEAGH